MDRNPININQVAGVPLNDLSRIHSSIRLELDEVWAHCIDDSDFISGDGVAKFENSFSASQNFHFTLGVANGTDAIEIALEALGVGLGDEVIVPSLTWISTAEAVSSRGAIPIFADCEAEIPNISLSSIKRLITKKTVGVIVVHLHGAAANVEAIAKFCKSADIWMLEDSAQSHGLTKYSSQVGKHCIASTFSFFPGKNLGAFGDGGAISTNSEGFINQCRLLANHGTIDKVNFEFPGRNSRLDALQAAILSVKLKYLNKWTEDRIRTAVKYDNLLKDIKSTRLINCRPNGSVYHQYVICVERRDQVLARLREFRVQTGIHYKTPLPLTKAYKGARGEYTNALYFSNSMLSLPIFPEIKDVEIEYVYTSLLDAVKN